jgi:hypothetical protein
VSGITVVIGKEPLLEAGDYQHTITADVGFDSASFSVGIAKDWVSHWLTNILGRPVIAYNRNGKVIWEGFVDQIVLSLGATQMTVGPLTEIANKVRAAYQTIDYSIVYIPSEDRVTGWASNISSQDRYFIMEQEITIGTAAGDTEAEQIRDTYLAEMSYPAIVQSASLGSSTSAYNADVSCKGFAHLLDYQFYSNFTAGDQNLSDKIIAALAAYSAAGAYAAGLFSDETSAFDTNTTQVPAWEEGDKTIMGVIKDTLVYGDSNFARWTFGIYEEAKATLRAVSESAHYTVSVVEDAREVREIGATGTAVVLPELVRPGYMALATDAYIGQDGLRGPQDDLDTRLFFVESVSFNAPASVSLNGSRLSRVSQQIARLGLGAL